ncbi:MAG: hypothetical protein K6A23_04260 [Butyrivibrio sp.]|nr:hypothetical protein [Butyrivibrio sp.]
MQSFRYRMFKTFSLIFLCFSFIMIFSKSVYAWEAHLNEDNEIEIYTVDKKRTTGIWYYTDGVSITRCKYNPTTKEIHESGDFFATRLQCVSEVLTAGVYYNTWTIPLNDVVEKVNTFSNEWAEEIEKAIDGTGPAVYLKLDCIVTVTDGINYYGPYSNTPEDNGGNNEAGIDGDGNSILTEFQWKNENGLKTHYNHYLLIGEGEITEIEDVSDELVTYDYTMDHYAGIDANQPAYAMSNYSSDFNLADGIPSSEYIENSFLADSWCGNTKVYARTLSKEYTHTITYRWEIDEGQYIYVDTDNDGISETPVWDSDVVTYSESREIPIGTAYVSFQYLVDTNIYDFTNADIQNGAYDGDHVYYDDTNEVSMSCISSSAYEELGSGGGNREDEPDWVADTNDHVEMGEFKYYTTYDFGRVAEKPDIDEAVTQDRDKIREIISDDTKSRNDKLVIDGHEFMNNEWVTGCDFFDSEPSTYTSCVSSAAWINDYCLNSGIRPLHEFDPADVTGTVSVQIPATVDNGYYATSMKVYYQRLISYSKASKTFECGE